MIRGSHGVAVGVGAASALLLIAAGYATAIDVQVTTVLAFERGPSDVQLTQYRPRLRRLAGYRSFRIVREERRQSSWGRDETFALPGGRVLRVVPKGMRDEGVLMRILLLNGAKAIVDTDVRLQNRGVMFIGERHDPESTEGALIIMVRAEE